MTQARKTVVSRDESGVYHCVSRCGRRAFLCGRDAYSGKKDLSWFMPCLNENLARRANREDRCTGRFWEGRFKCQRLMDEEYYLSLVEWTGRHLRKDKPGYLPANLQTVLDRFELDAKAWAKNVESYGGLFHRIAGKAEQLLDFAKSGGQRWFLGRNGSESLYRSDRNHLSSRQKAA